MANDDQKSADANKSKCSVCGEKFNSLQECLKHELVKHSLNKKNKKQNHLQKRLNAAKKHINAEQKLSERQQLKERLSKCHEGQELHVIFELFCMKTDTLGLIFTRIQTCLEKELRPAGIVRIYAFGSIGSGLALRDCDIDIYLDASGLHTSPRHRNHIQKENQDYQHSLAFNRINNLLHRSPHFTDVFAIRRARVPIIKCKHRDTGFSIDINISCPSSRANTQFVYEVVRSDDRIHELMLFIKLWAKNTQIIGRDNMTSYCLVTMIIFYLQQPWESKNPSKTGVSNTRILKSIKELQMNCPFNMVQGINYAYDLQHKENKPQIPTSVTTWDLIKGFFNFYYNFNFEDYIISPFYGKSVEKTKLTPDIFEEYYKQLRTITQYLQGEQPNDLQIDRCMCVQDAFSLNQNTAKNILPHGKEYITLCLRNAQKICKNPNNLNMSALYEQLLFDTILITDNVKVNELKDNPKTEVIDDLKNLKLPTVESDTVLNNSGSQFSYTFVPSKVDVRTLSSLYPNLAEREALLRCWCQKYINAIEIIITKLYHMDVQKNCTAQQKQQKLDEENADKELIQSWLISCSIDLWSNRCFQKNGLSMSFLTYQLEQTERLHNLRRQDPKYSVSLNCVLKINILPNYMGINIELQLPEGSIYTSLTKKCPLRKFFNIFKNTLQSCNFKETLNMVDAKFETTNEDDSKNSTDNTRAAEKTDDAKTL